MMSVNRSLHNGLCFLSEYVSAEPTRITCEEICTFKVPLNFSLFNKGEYKIVTTSNNKFIAYRPYIFFNQLSSFE